MKRHILIGALVTVGVGCGIAANMHPTPAMVKAAVVPASASHATVTAPVVAHGGERVGEPHTLTIPSLNIRAPIIGTGLEANGEMAVPDSLTQAGWYAKGAAPGNPGKAVIAMHTGYPNKPSVFRAIERLKPGDEVQTTDVSGITASFQVIERATYHPDAAPRDRIFGDSPTARLALITCTGQWNARTQQYSDRLVVYAVRKD